MFILKKYQLYLCLFFLLIITIFVYIGILAGFFQQDEWLVFDRLFLLQQKNIFQFLSDVFKPSLSHFTPLTLLVLFFSSKTFGLNYEGYAAESLVLHLITLTLFYFLCLRIFKKVYIAFAAALLFAVSGINYQGTTWVIADIGTHGAAILALLSGLSFVGFLKNKSGRLFVVSIVFYILSLFFKETTFALIGFYLITFHFLGNSELKQKRIFPLTLMVIGLVYFGFRASMFFILGAQSVSSVQASKEVFIYNALTLPAKSLVQSIIPPQLFIAITDTLQNLLAKTSVGDIEIFNSPLLFQQIVLEILNLLTFAAMIIAGYFLSKSEAKQAKSIILFSALFVVINSFILVLSPERNGIISLIDSRNLYLLSMGGSVILIFVASIICGTKRLVFYLFILPFFTVSLFFLNKELISLKDFGQTREKILNQIEKDYHKLPSRTVFYTESNTSFYGFPPETLIMPFQSGFGQTLLVWYYPSEKFPNDFLQNRFLWEITSQGYRELNGRGFGYFRDFDSLVKTMDDYNLDKASVIAYRYDLEKKSVEDITQEVQGRIDGFRARKSLVTQIKAIKASINSDDISLAVDKNRETYWSSKIPYSIPIFVEVELNGEKRIAQIQIDSYNSKDQNEVGYRVALSKDDQNWENVFFSKKYPPDKSGMVNLYFSPTEAKYIKIEQVGYHKYAPWVINELHMYESLDQEK